MNAVGLVECRILRDAFEEEGIERHVELPRKLAIEGVEPRDVSRSEIGRGAHAREDFPNRDDKIWMKHTLAWTDGAKNKVTLGYRPVHDYTMTNDVQYIPPKARVY